ncbi:Protein of unknown function [Gryllus bimaculatus]|nr:Protein of unknown function [Gryllus bimaculatus]
MVVSKGRRKLYGVPKNKPTSPEEVCSKVVTCGVVVCAGPAPGQGGRVLQLLPALQLPARLAARGRRDRGGVRPVLTSEIKS